ncbi:TPA: hypothetical protein RHY09_001176 [Escherichia coli]|nr:hypothetical protein [Escherichia coli]EHS0230667.1 hypothetical protein [Escherichia coli]EIW8248594.1 hypothetical protein [Escherichia coli]HDV1336425.1 hypothetical protein [Escherichia coli]HDV1355254.1 hypothetical protein [Escherichia coli]
MSIAVVDSHSFPVSICNPFRALFSSLPVKGINSELAIHCPNTATELSSFEGCGYDLQALEDAFDCDFITMPDNVHNEDDFYKWIMEVNLD